MAGTKLSIWGRGIVPTDGATGVGSPGGNSKERRRYKRRRLRLYFFSGNQVCDNSWGLFSMFGAQVLLGSALH